MITNISITLILLLLAVFLEKLFKLILPLRMVTDNYKYVRLARLLSLVAAIGCGMQCTDAFSSWGFIPRLLVYVIAFGLALIVEMLFIIITKGTKWQYISIGLFLLSAACTVYSFNERIATSITSEAHLKADVLELKSSVYTLSIPLRTITEVTLEQTFPNTSYRNNGFSMDEINMGYFVLNDDRNCFLFLINRSSPFIRIERGKEFPVFINLQTSEETTALYEQLRLAQEKQGK